MDGQPRRRSYATGRGRDLTRLAVARITIAPDRLRQKMDCRPHGSETVRNWSWLPKLSNLAEITNDAKENEMFLKENAIWDTGAIVLKAETKLINQLEEIFIER